MIYKVVIKCVGVVCMREGEDIRIFGRCVGFEHDDEDDDDDVLSGFNTKLTTNYKIQLQQQQTGGRPHILFIYDLYIIIIFYIKRKSKKKI